MALIPVHSPAETSFDIDSFKAYAIQKDFLREWEPKREVWSLNYGHYIIGIAAGASGLVVNSMFRRKLRLLHNGFATTSAFLSLGPGVLAAMSHEYYITRKIMLYESECTACTGAKAMFSLYANGILHPLIISPAINIAIAGHLGYRIPHFTEIKELARLWWSIVKPYSSNIARLFLVNTVLASIIVYKQLTSMEIVTKVLLRIRERTKAEQELADNSLRI